MLGQALLPPLQPSPSEFIPYQPPFHPTTPPNPRQVQTTPTRPGSSIENRTDMLAALRSRLATKNNLRLKSAIESNSETSNLTLDCDLILNRLVKNTNWTNRDLGLLLLAMSGVIPISVEPAEQVASPTGDVVEESTSDLEGI